MMKISFKRPEDVLPSAMILVSFAILIGTLLFLLLVHEPSAASVKTSHNGSERLMYSQIHKLDAKAADAQAKVNARLWQGDAETIATSILGNVTAQANRLSLKVAAFRPQRTAELDGMTELPFNVQITGPYEKVRTVIASFDEPDSKVALRSAQIATSSASTSNDVTATLIVSAYQPATPAAAPAVAASPVATTPRTRTVAAPPARKVTTITTGGANGGHK